MMLLLCEFLYLLDFFCVLLQMCSIIKIYFDCVDGRWMGLVCERACELACV